MQVQTNVIDASFRYGVRKLLFLGSSCIYPKLAPQPLREDVLLSGPLEPTNEWYAIAKISGVKMCEAYFRQHGFPAISVMPTNLYGPGDNFDLMQSHVVPALLVKAHAAMRSRAPAIEVWGTGAVRREFLYVDDAADGMVYLMQNYSDEAIVNLGPGSDVSIVDLVGLICKVVGYKGGIQFDSSRPDGVPRKMVDTTFAASLGWRAKTPLRDGLALLKKAVATADGFPYAEPPDWYYPPRQTLAAWLLRAKKWTEAQRVLDDARPHDDALASAWYRQRLLPVLVRRALDDLGGGQ